MLIHKSRDRDGANSTASRQAGALSQCFRRNFRDWWALHIQAIKEGDTGTIDLARRDRKTEGARERKAEKDEETKDDGKK